MVEKVEGRRILDASLIDDETIGMFVVFFVSFTLRMHVTTLNETS